MSEQEQRKAPVGIEVTRGVWVLPSQGNGFAVETPDGVVVVDTGPGGRKTDQMIAALRALTDSPVIAICYSHGHFGYNFGVPQWLDHNAERGDDAPRLIAHRNLPLRYDRYRETEGYQAILNEMQFPGISARFEPTKVDPTETFDDHMVLCESPRIELLWVPSETDCALAMWLPDTRTLFAGAAVPADFIPNVGTPQRSLRLTGRWADTLDRLIELRPEVLVIEFGAFVTGEDLIAERMTTTAHALRWLRSEVVARLNHGMNDREILADLDYPPEVFDYPWLTHAYGSPDYIVRDLVREESGWWDRNPTSLHPAAPADVARVTFDAIADPDAVIAQAEALAADGNPQLAMHVIDLVALGPDDEPAVTRARAIKSDLCRERSKQVTPYPSKGLYKSSGIRLKQGIISWEGVGQ
ncbi:alkyl sulfatase dimerization domain-containing protein [Ilumatobacter sp.]|uniref:alkyl sulfatase dimerization domain-containing protein n=1 Tax=Ilumatobacter sp. TaxID=1967498 RepID=UPI0030ADA24F